jgi:hypothetical protein
LGESHRTVGFPQVAALHHHAVQPVRQAGQFRAFELDDRDDLDASRFEPGRVLREAMAILGGSAAKLLELLAGGGFAGAQSYLDFVLGERASL